MANSPELQHSRVPRIAMAAAAIISLAYLPDLKPVEHSTLNHQTNINAEPLIKNTVHKHLGNLALSEHLATKPTPAQQAAREVTPLEFAQWSKVAICEEGGNWHVYGSKYSGGLGISNANWVHYGGTYFAANGSIATPNEQIVVAMRIQSNPPDQNGCHKW